MTRHIQAPRINLEKTPRELISGDYISFDEIPISGGWGYTKEGAVVIDKEDPVVPKNAAFDGIGIEYLFVERRIQEELNLFESGKGKYTGFEWDLLEQRLVFDGNRKYDVLMFEVSAIQEREWHALKNELDGHAELQRAKSGVDSCNSRRIKKLIRYRTEYWFDITSFYGTD